MPIPKLTDFEGLLTIYSESELRLAIAIAQAIKQLGGGGGGGGSSVTVTSGNIEISNDAGNPIPISGNILDSLEAATQEIKGNFQSTSNLITGNLIGINQNIGSRFDNPAASGTSFASINSLLKLIANQISAKTILTASGIFNTPGNNTLIPNVAGKSICITSIIIQLEAASSIVILLTQSSTILKRILLVVQGDALVINYAPGFELKLPASVALLLNASNANQINYSIEYFLE